MAFQRMFQGWHTLGDMSRGREARTSPFLCTHRTHVAGTLRRLLHTKRILVHFYVVARTVCTVIIEVILSLFCDAQIQTSCIILWGQTFVLATELTPKSYQANCRCNVSPKHAPGELCSDISRKLTRIGNNQETTNCARKAEQSCWNFARHLPTLLFILFP